MTMAYRVRMISDGHWFISSRIPRVWYYIIDCISPCKASVYVYNTVYII